MYVLFLALELLAARIYFAIILLVWTAKVQKVWIWPQNQTEFDMPALC